MADEIWVNGELAHKNASKFVNEGGVSGVSAGTVDQSAFNVRNRHNAREWLFYELGRQKYREMYNITFDSDDGGEKERFAAARREYFDTYGEDFMGYDPNTPWQDTYPGEAVDKPTEAIEPEKMNDTTQENNSDELETVKNAYAELTKKYTALLERLDELAKRLEE